MGGSSIDNQMVMFVMELVREEIYIMQVARHVQGEL